MSLSPKTYTMSRGAILLLFHACQDIKAFTEILDLTNAGAFVKLVERKIPNIRRIDKDVPQEKHEEWLGFNLQMKLSQSIFDTLKVAFESRRKNGMLGATNNTRELLKLFSLMKPEDDIAEELLRLNEDDAPEAASAAGG